MAEREREQVIQASEGSHIPLEAAHPARVSVGDQRLTIEEAIQRYLQDHQRARHQPKTVV